MRDQGTSYLKRQPGRHVAHDIYLSIRNAGNHIGHLRERSHVNQDGNGPCEGVALKHTRQWHGHIAYLLVVGHIDGLEHVPVKHLVGCVCHARRRGVPMAEDDAESVTCLRGLGQELRHLKKQHDGYGVTQLDPQGRAHARADLVKDGANHRRVGPQGLSHAHEQVMAHLIPANELRPSPQLDGERLCQDTCPLSIELYSVRTVQALNDGIQDLLVCGHAGTGALSVKAQVVLVVMHGLKGPVNELVLFQLV